MIPLKIEVHPEPFSPGTANSITSRARAEVKRLRTGQRCQFQHGQHIVTVTRLPLPVTGGRQAGEQQQAASLSGDLDNG